jgi:tetratricopeptide (TPR) repeat protein
MATRFSKKMNFLLLFFIIGTLLYFQKKIKDRFLKPKIEISMQLKSVNFNEQLINTFNLGQGRLISSILWIHTLIESDLEHYKKKDLNSWIYLRFNSIITIEPDFYEAYLYGGQYLSIIKDDIYGARKILDQGTKKFPGDFWLNFYAGFNYYFELGDVENAFKHYSAISNHPLQASRAPNLHSMLAKLKFSMGDTETAYQLMKTAYEQLPENHSLRKKFYNNLYSAKAEMDLGCLNAGQSNCSMFDQDGVAYIQIGENQFKAQKTWRKFKLNVKRKDNWESKN